MKRRAGTGTYRFIEQKEVGQYDPRNMWIVGQPVGVERGQAFARTQNDFTVFGFVRPTLAFVYATVLT
jgi:hypothetical protein